MQNASLEALRQFVTAKDGERRFGPTTLSLNISHSNLSQKWIEIRFDMDDTIDNVKDRLYKHGGTTPSMQKLQLLDTNGRLLCELADGRKRLRDYQVQNNYEIRIIDLDPHSLARGGWLEDTSLVEKYVMPDEVYDARKDTVRRYKQEMAAKQKTDDRSEPKNESITVDENIVIGRRCEVAPGGRRGEIRFVGLAESLGEGFWVGVALDEPLGKNDGTVKGKRYFTCAPNFGVMVRPDSIQVGEFNVRGLEDPESDDEI